MDVVNGADRRRYPRIPVSWPVRLWVDENSLVGRAIEASAYGLFVLTAPTSTIKQGQCARVEVVAGMDDPYSYVADVRHVRSDGIGIETRLPLLA